LLHPVFCFEVMFKRGFIIFGVVSLTMGNSVFPFGNRQIIWQEAKNS